uniref:Serine/threonine-protein kinase ATM n=1 Tax=Timema monikensis TaxID=170555 RepID=A0A7R9EC58_9NEOP|nr:unnamed protein product [Timema monikensis]
MLNVVHYIRLQGVVRDNTSQSLDMDYLHVAQAAQFCSAHFTSILYVELWSSEQIKEHPSIIVGDNVSPLDCICDKDPERGRDVEDILREAYTRLQYKDAVSGCGSSYLLDSLTRVSHLELEGQWEQAMQEYQLQSKNDDPTAIQGLCRCLHRMGSHNLLHRYLAATEKTSELLDIQYECGWRLGQWDLGRCPQDDLYEGHHYDALQATEEGDLVRARVSLSRARTCIATTALAHASLESAMNLYPSLSRLQTLQELEDFLNDNPLNQDSVKLLMTRWREQDRLGYGEFEYLELVLAQRLVLLRMASSMFNFNVKDELTYQLEIAALARKEGWPQVAGNCLARLATFSFDKPPCIVLEEARLHWAKGNREVAIVLLKSLLRRLEQDTRGGEEQLVQRSIALHLYGSWMVETKSENPQNIIDQYFLKALTHLEDLAESREKQEICLEAHSSLARFADGQYQNLVHYTKSAVFETKQKGIVEAQVALEKIRKEPHTDEMKKMSSILSRQKSIDTLEVENTEKEKNNYLTLAVKYYCQSLQRGDKHNLQVFRLVSLWLDNMSHEALADILNTELGNIPSYKFLPLLPQLSARISNDANNPFVYKLNKLLAMCTLYSVKQSRVLGAKMLLDRLQSVDTIAPILAQMNKLSEALISLAYYKFGKDRGTYIIPNTEPILRIKNYDRALLPSFTLPVSKSGQYNNIVGIHSFENKFEYLGGVTLPKKFTCTDTNGIKHALLVKGQDDLRQDAVMQQVFTIMNMLLRENKETNKRKLLIRTYKIVPLSQRSGVLEWCRNTMPMEDYLVSIKGAHKRYFPDDYSNNQCRSLMNKACKLSNAERLKVYLDICTHFHPVFHHFFLENFRTPGVWFERRQAYMHSVATSSMIGYILGLGDRHVKNILLDKTTAEIIHIDFGKILPTPETVPFRLTRDIVDGMGVSGIEGVFRKSCEKTMSVLRQNQVTILTILEVLLYDPLYAWTITPSEGFKRQHKDQGPIRDSDREATKEVNKLAERALTRLKQKLDGTEDGTVTSVNGQVNKLLHQARDPVNLSRLYDGWQPFL